MKNAKTKESKKETKKESKQTKDDTKVEQLSPTKVTENQTPPRFFKILVGYRNGLCQMLDYTTKTFDHSWEELHNGPILHISTVQQSNQFITGGGDSTIKVIDLNTRQISRTIKDESECN